MHFQHVLSHLAHYRLSASHNLGLTSSFPTESVSSIEFCKFANQLERNWWSREKKLQITELICSHLSCRSHFQRQTRLHGKATKKLWLQWKAPPYKPKFLASLLRQKTGTWSRCQGCQENPRDEKSLKRTKGGIYHKRKFSVLVAGSELKKPFLGESCIIQKPTRNKKRGEEGILSPENKHNEDYTRKPRRQYTWFHRWF